MKNFDLNEFGVKEMENFKLIEINGGQAVQSPWWSVLSTAIQAAVIILESAAKAYVEYSEKTGGDYVIHHAV
jgi:hypothetical protein